MKKMLFMAMAAVVLMACNSSDTGLPKGEEKALEKTTVGAIAQLGTSPSQVDAALTDAGYMKITGGYVPPISSPEKVTPKKIKKAVAASQKAVVYAYGIPENYNTMTQAQAMVWINNALANGKALMLVYANFIDDKLAVMMTTFVIAKDKNANKSFTAISEDMYGELPSGKTNYYWVGEIYDRNVKDSEAQEFSDHSAFVSKVAKAEGIEAEENGAAMFKGWAYGNTWINPTAAEEAEMIEEGLSVAVCIGGYVVTNQLGDL